MPAPREVDRRLQRQIYVKPIGADRRQLRVAAEVYPAALPEHPGSPAALAVPRRAPGESLLMLLRQNARQSLAAEVDPTFRRDVLRGLGAEPRAIPARWLYDRRGSELFEAITALPEYYPTRTERSILSHAVREIAALIGPKRAVVEFGSGSSTKTLILLSEVSPTAYVPIDISAEFLRESVAAFSAVFPELPIFPIEGDFTGTFGLPEAIDGVARLGFFPGSTIGNLLVPDAVDLLRAMAAILGAGSMLLIGIDRIKNPDILLPAYDDAQGVTAAFNLNLLHRINRELGGTVPVDTFSHVVRWNDVEARIEMHLEAARDVHFLVDGRLFSMASGETIHTENSLKYDVRDARVLLRAGGWTPIADWTDQKEFFSLILAKVGTAALVPNHVKRRAIFRVMEPLH
jgi:L-histidine Nalpha-methyltransferase